MTETAATRVERLLQILALAGGEDGIAYEELADRLGVDRKQLDRDLEELTTREFYLPGGAGGDIQVTLGTDRVRVWTTGAFRRPPRLGPGEAAALDLGLRILAGEQDDPELRERLAPLLAKLAWAVPDDVLDRFRADGDPGAADPIRAGIIDAARRRVRVRFRYLKPDAERPEQRSVEPYTVAYAEGRWYVIGHCPERDGIRMFRVDRILDATLDEATFDAPADFSPSDYITDGRVYQADEEVEVTVRYAGRVAPWLRERGEGEVQEDGGVIVRHRVADPAWIVGHVLQYGSDARVVEPEWVKGLVAEAAERVASGPEAGGA